MALADNELFSENSVPALKRARADHVIPARFALGVGTIAVLQAVAYDTALGYWAPWDANGANGRDVIGGFLWDHEITLDADEEVLGVVMVAGEVHVDDIELGVETLADLKLALADDARQRNLHIQGLETFH